MNGTYLDRFRSSLPKTQGNQILKLLVSKRDSGEIRTIDEFKTQLKALTTQILEERITPTLKRFNAIAGADTSSEQYNEMLSRIEDDLEAAFVEADNIDDIIEAHHNLIEHVALKALRYGVNELESKISLYEFLNRSGKGFDDALFNTFRESSNFTTTRSDKAATLVFVDPQRKEAVDSDEDAQVDLVGERLILGADKTKYLSIREASWLSNASSIRSELDVEFKNSRISNIIDNKNNTYWVVPILLSEIRAAGVPMEINLRLGSSQDVNFIEIEPASNFPMVLTGIDYYDSNNSRQSTVISSVALTGPTRINFERITTNAIILRFRQDNYREIQFKMQAGESNFHKAVLGETADTVDLVSISEDLQELLTSDFILTDVFGIRESETDQVKYYEYLLGFDNIRAGFSTFDERSIFASQKKTVTKPGQVGLRIDEVRPVQVEGSASITLESHAYPERSGAEDAKFYHGSVEYYLVTQQYSSDNFLISTDTIPLLPLGAERIYHERVVFIATGSGATNPNIAQSRFFMDADSTDVLVYRNGTLLTWGTDWVFVDSGDTDVGYLTVTTSSAGSPMKRAIRISDTVQPLDIYTISYTPKLSNTQVVPADSTLLKVTDMIGDESARITAQNIIVFESLRLAHSVEYAEMYLVIIIRRNSAEYHFSPAIEEYLLVTGSKDTEKFS